MKLKEIKFSNYKAFEEEQTFKLFPVTVLLGANNSGKTAVSKLLSLLSESLSGNLPEGRHLSLKVGELEFGSKNEDFVYGQNPGIVSFQLSFDENNTLNVEIDLQKQSQKITEWICSEGTYPGEKFNGFIPFIDEINKIEEQNVHLLITLKNFQFSVDHIGPIRNLPERFIDYTRMETSDFVGYKGLFAYENLLSDYFKFKDGEETDFFKSVSEKLKSLTNVELKIRDFENGTCSINLLKENTSAEINIRDSGFGISQALPLIIRACMERTCDIVVVEQPELHLHPRAHGDLIELLAQSAVKKDQSYIIETHSEVVLLRLRRLIAKKELKPDEIRINPEDVGVYWVEDGKIYLIEIDENGDLSEDLPLGVFEEDITELKGIIKKK